MMVHGVMPLVPNGTVVHVAGDEQPCVSSVTVGGADAIMDIEILGHYSLCRMPIDGAHDLVVIGPGKTVTYVVVTMAGEQVLDIDVKP